MKQCERCSTSCYDNELFCRSCGAAILSNCHCSYCGSKIEPYMRSCGACGGKIELDLCPETVRQRICGKCHVAVPRGKFCSNCGQRFSLSPKAIASIVIVSIAALILGLVGFIIIGGIVSNMITDDYLAQEKAWYEEYPTAEYISVSIEDLLEDLESYPVGTFLELTGVFDNDFYCLIYHEINASNRDKEVSIRSYNWDIYDDLVNHHVIGDEVTLKCVVTDIYPSLNRAHVTYFEIM